MTNLPLSVGFITVTARGLIGLGDSEDVDTQPDSIPMSASVSFVPSITNRPLVAIDEDAPRPIIPLYKITAAMDASGNLRPPTGGENAPPIDASGNLRLVAPDGPGIDLTGWYWTANFTPTSNQKWSAFSVTFGGEGGDVVDLGDILSSIPPVGIPTLTNLATKSELDDVAEDLAAEIVLARNADNLTSGTIIDARIPSTIARDSEVTSAVSVKLTAKLVSTDGSGGLPAPTGVGLEFVIQDDAFFDIRWEGSS